MKRRRRFENLPIFVIVLEEFEIGGIRRFQLSAVLLSLASSSVALKSSDERVVGRTRGRR